jgi:hypothetical protein
MNYYKWSQIPKDTFVSTYGWDYKAKICTNGDYWIETLEGYHCTSNYASFPKQYQNIKWFICDKQGNPTHKNTLQEGDKVKRIHGENPHSDIGVGEMFTVRKVFEDDVYYRDGFALNYMDVELVTKKEVKMKYPVMLQHSTSKLVVCFSSKNVGHVVEDVGETHSVDYYSDAWIEAANSEMWKPYVPEPEMETVYEWMARTDNDVCWVVSALLITEEEAEKEFKNYQDYRKTGREFKVPKEV